MRVRAMLLPALAGLLALGAAASDGRKQSAKDLPPNHPSLCPYCAGDPAIMAAAGIVSHGGFEFGRSDTAAVDQLLPTCDIRWIETAHFEVGLALPPVRTTQDEKEKIRTECARLAQAMPQVPLKPTTLDPWLRAHLYAQRLEDLWKEILVLLDVEESDFPDGTRPWDMSGKYMGEGPYLGEKGKYEVLVVPNEGTHSAFLKEHFGVPTKKTQRYNVIERDTMILVIHTQQEGLREDQALHGHMVFNVSQNFLDGYKHYSYNLPVWVREGVAHYLERRINPKFNSFDGSEGSVGEQTRKEDWQSPTLKLVRSGKAPRMAELMAMKDYADLTLDRHFVCWSMIDFMQAACPGFLAKLLDQLKGITTTEGFADGSNLGEVHRQIFKDELGMSYAQFDAAWAAWVEANYRAQ